MREQWNNKLGFLLAAIGSAVGLGNIWRFPYVAGTNGGGAFLIPYFFAIVTAGIPILILEYTMGKTYHGGAPVTLARMNKKFEILGWFQTMVAFVISTYYVAIIVWTLKYLQFSLTLEWGDDPTGFFLNFLGATDSASNLGGIQMNLLFPFLIVWAIVAFIMYKGVRRGIEVVCRVTLPILMLLIVLLVIRGITLPGAVDGLNYLFQPDWSALKKPSVWVAAYGQIFFSLSIGFAIMVSYASYLPKKTDVVNSACITATANHGFEVFTAIGIFGIVGFMAGQQGVDVAEVAGGGVGLAFMTFPTAINALPAFNALFAICFFGALFIAAITSMISILQAVIASMHDKFNIDHNVATTIVVLPSFLISTIFITGGGLNILDIVDAFVNNLGIVGCGCAEVFLLGWFFKTEKLRQEANRYSNFSIGKWWNYALKFVTVFVLGVMIVLNTIDYVCHGYGGFATKDVAIFGWGAILFVVIAGFIFTLMKGKDGYRDLDEIAHKEGQ